MQNAEFRNGQHETKQSYSFHTQESELANRFQNADKQYSVQQLDEPAHKKQQ